MQKGVQLKNFSQRGADGKKTNRKAAEGETSAVTELCRVQRKYVLELFGLFGATTDPRNQCYITYTNRMMLRQMYFKGIAGIVSMQGMTQAFNDKKVSENMSLLMGCTERKCLPHHVTENEYLERLDPGEMEEVIRQMVYGLIRRRTFEDVRSKKRWLIIVDESQTYPGDSLVCSIASEFNENSDEYRERYRGMSEEEYKQDCEINAFRRLAEKIKKRYLRLPVLLGAGTA